MLGLRAFAPSLAGTPTDLDRPGKTRILGSMGSRFSLAKFTVSETPWEKSSRWKVEIPATVAGRRIRKFFQTEGAARMWAQNMVDNYHEEGRGAVDAEMGQSVAEAASMYLAARLPNVGDRHGKTMRLYMRRIAEEFGSMPLARLKVRHVEQLIQNPNWSQRSRYTAFGYYRTFLEWCRKRDLIEKNPALALDDIRPGRSPKAILSVDEMRRLLKLAKQDPHMHPFVVLGGFAGLRTAEIQRLDWSAVDLDHGEIFISQDVAKDTRSGGGDARYVTIRPVLQRHLPDRRAGPVIACNETNFNRHRERLTQAMGWKDWPHNCLRHSFASYLLAEREDAGAVAHQLGHSSPAMVRQAYARAVRKADAAAWWAI